MLARDQLRQIFAFLRLRPVAPDLVNAEIGMRPVGEADRGGAAADLLHRDAMGKVAHASAAIFFLDGDPVKTERAHLGPQLDRKAVGTVDLRGERRDAVLGEAANRRSQHVDLGAEVKVEGRQPRVLHGSNFGGLVRSRRLELPRSFPHSDLNAARLPIPPRPHDRAGVISKSGLLYQAAWILAW